MKATVPLHTTTVLRLSIAITCSLLVQQRATGEDVKDDPGGHWAFRTPQRPALPRISDPTWPANPVDAFLHAQYDKVGIKPAPDASAAQILRRVYLDLTGLPPTGQQLQDFLENPAESHYRTIVDRLLNSPQYGERWARHWMDVWRYSDWYGRRSQDDVRNSAPQIWRWRDWVIHSLNDDKSYARMIQEMLAGDEIAPEDDSAWPATGYLIRNYYSLNPNEWMRHNVEYTAKAFLGLTFNCAHCHDHKYDPISHEDYFRMRAFFEPIGIRHDRVEGGPEPAPFPPYVYNGSRKAVRQGMARLFDAAPERETWFYTDGDERNKLKDRGSIPPGVPGFLPVPQPEIRPIDLPMTGWYPGSRRNIQRTILDERRSAVADAERHYAEAWSSQGDTSALEATLDKTRREFETALANSVSSGEAGALSGKQSLYLDATAGRRIVQNTIPGLASLPEATTITFQLHILKDSHVNFQLARDTSKGLTALFLGFVNGQIKAYQPGGFTEFTAATYDVKSGQRRFDVKLEIYPAQDIARLSVRVHGETEPLVADRQIALNGWNPTANPSQPFTFDCRAGTQALVDDVLLVAGKQRYCWDFEAPTFGDGEDVAGNSGWVVHPESAARGLSVVSMIAGCESARASYQEFKQAEAALRQATLGQAVAELRLTACRLKLQSTTATIAADNAKSDQCDRAKVTVLSKQACAKQIQAKLADARWKMADAQHRLIETAAAEKTKAVQAQVAALNKHLAAARQAISKLQQQRATAGESTEYELLSPTTSKQSTGRRSALAYWITDPKNPLTPRVAINHIWMRHFHAPLVETVFDFGRNGKAPTHPELLDWLAVELIENGWRMKHIHRLIVTSRSYRLSSAEQSVSNNQQIDRANKLLWRMNRGRMEAEVIRDSVLFIAGKLDLRLGGRVLPNTEAMTGLRRSIYYEVYPEGGGNTELAETFDAPDPTECFRRTNTIVPQQALALSNSQIIHQCSSDAARSLGDDSVLPDDAALVTAAFIKVLSRPPVERELKAAAGFLAKQRHAIGEELKVRESLVRVLFNHNDFVSIR